MIDLLRVLPVLSPGAVFRLDSSTPPHRIVEWRGDGVVPSISDIEKCWADILKVEEEKPRKNDFDERLALLELEVFGYANS